MLPLLLTPSTPLNLLVLMPLLPEGLLNSRGAVFRAWWGAGEGVWGAWPEMAADASAHRADSRASAALRRSAHTKGHQGKLRRVLVH